MYFAGEFKSQPHGKIFELYLQKLSKELHAPLTLTVTDAQPAPY